MIKSRRGRWVKHVARNGSERNAHRLLVGKAEGKKPLGGPRHRWVDSIKLDLAEIGQNGLNWIGLAQDRDKWRALANAVMNLCIHKMLGNYQVATQLVSQLHS
jgi:hypothetical protein